jgi:transcriptional regulator with XRE-family HTH domain
MSDDVADRLAANVKKLRQARSATQNQMAKLAALPRATWANLESGTANPTLSVLRKVALALQVSLEELVAPPRATAKHYAKAVLPTRSRGPVEIRKLLPDPVPGMEMERLELPPRTKMNGVPHTPGTREYLTCEKGRILLVASAVEYELAPGDVVVFRGDQRHSYANRDAVPAVGYSVVLLAPAL